MDVSKAYCHNCCHSEIERTYIKFIVLIILKACLINPVVFGFRLKACNKDPKKYYAFYESLPYTSSNMLKNHEDEHHKHETLEADTNSQYFIEIFHQFVSFLDNLEHSYHSCHSDNLVQLSNASNSCHASKMPIHEYDIKWYD